MKDTGKRTFLITETRSGPPPTGKEVEPDPDTSAGALLAALRGLSESEPWGKVAGDVFLRWWFGPEAQALTHLAKRHLVEYKQVSSGESALGQDVWARALTEAETESCRDVLAST